MHTVQHWSSEKPADRNIRAIASLEQALLHSRSRADRLAWAIQTFTISPRSSTENCPATERVREGLRGIRRRRFSRPRLLHNAPAGKRRCPWPRSSV